MQKRYLIVTIIGFIGVVLTTLLLFLYLRNERLVQDSYDGLTQLAKGYYITEDSVEVPNVVDNDSNATEIELTNNVDWESLLEVNADVVGWLTFEEANIDYPVVMCPEEDLLKYLNTTVDGTQTKQGSIFVLNTDDVFSHNLTYIHGHNMRNGTMFGSLKILYNSQEFTKDMTVTLDLPDGTTLDLHPTVACVVDEKSSLLAKSEDTSVEEYLTQVRKVALDSGGWCAEITNESPTKVIVLSTCYGYQGTTNRLITVLID